MFLSRSPAWRGLRFWVNIHLKLIILHLVLVFIVYLLHCTVSHTIRHYIRLLLTLWCSPYSSSSHFCYFLLTTSFILHCKTASYVLLTFYYTFFSTHSSFFFILYLCSSIFMVPSFFSCFFFHSVLQFQIFRCRLLVLVVFSYFSSEWSLVVTALRRYAE